MSAHRHRFPNTWAMMQQPITPVLDAKCTPYDKIDANTISSLSKYKTQRTKVFSILSNVLA
jgi:hypothetical protein